MNLSDLIQKLPQLPPRFLIYSIPGFGKSTLAASMPNPIFIDIEDGLMGIDVPALPIPKQFEDVVSYLDMLINDEHDYKSVLIDTLSSLEALIFDKVCRDYEKLSIESFGYAKGYQHALVCWQTLIGKLEQLRVKGIAPVLLAHSEDKTVNDPLLDSYDKYIIRLHKNAAAIITQWCDNILFGTHKAVVAQKGEGFNKTSKGIGHGERVLYTEERPAFTAKSRMNMPFEIDIPKQNGWAAVQAAIKNNNKG